MNQEKIRNIAIIAHVDHGKTTLVDQLFKQSGMYRDNQVAEDRVMDSMDLEKERGITISSKNGSVKYKDHFINIIDTPGHADFGGQVERVLNMVDGALLLIDAAEGPMPQTYYVLKKALNLKLPVLVVINKIDKPAARCEWVVEQIFELFVKLDAPNECIDFPVIYASAKEGYATTEEKKRTKDMTVLFDEIVNFIPHPTGDKNGVFQMLISTLDNSPFLGRLAIGKIRSGNIKINSQVVTARDTDISKPSRISKIYRFEHTSMVETDQASVGEIVAIAGFPDIKIGYTVTDADNPQPLPFSEMDQPTISMNFVPNDSPFSGLEGKYVTSRHLRDRLYKEQENDVALKIEERINGPGYKVSGRGELHLSILIEKMRREGYEFQITRPEVIFHIEDGKKKEPYEELIIDVDDQYASSIISKLGERKGIMLEMMQENGSTRLVYKIPTRGLLGFSSEFLTEAKGMGTMNHVFMEYDVFAGTIRNRNNGALVVMENCTTVAYALFNLQSRGIFFTGPGEKVYEGQIIGENNRENDMTINPGKGKKLTNVRAAGSDENVILTPFTKMSLEKCIEFINDDELVEVTPQSIRLRKILLKESNRKRDGRKK